MASEALFAVLPEPFGGGVDHDLIVARLEGYEIFGGVVRGPREGVHVWFGDEFYRDGDVVF